MAFSFTQLQAHFTCPGTRRGRVFSSALIGVLGLIICPVSVLSDLVFAAAESPAAARLHVNARNAEKLGNLRSAMEYEQQAAHLAPANVIYQGEYARLLWASGFVERAIKECRTALKLDPDNTKLRFNVAVMLQSTGDPKSAIVEYEKLLKSTPTDVQARLGYLQSLALAGRSQEAVNQLDALSLQARKFPLTLIEVANTAIEIDQPHRAKEMLRDFASSGNSRALSLLYMAAASDNDEKLALSIQKKVLNSAPKDGRIYLVAAKLVSASNDSEAEDQILRQAMKSVHNDGDLYAQLAGIYLNNFAKSKTAASPSGGRGWLDLAERALKFAEEIHVKAWRYRFAHAGVLALQGRSDEAAAMIEELARTEPKNELVQYCRGRLRAYSNNPAAMARRNLKSLFGEAQRSGASPSAFDDAITLACSRAYFDKLGCGCHTAVLELKWKRSGGVLYSKVISEHPAVGLIVHKMGDPEGFKGRIISAAASINERITRVETETVKGLGALSMNVVAPEAQEKPPLMARLAAPELQKL